MKNLKMDDYRAIVRPTITLVFSILIAVMFYQEKAIPDLFRITWLAILAEWFGERFILKLLGISVANGGRGLTPSGTPTQPPG